MARSTHIWSVTQIRHTHPVAVFTVKRELAAWWALQDSAAHARMRVWRHHDARPDIDPVDVTHWMETT